MAARDRVHGLAGVWVGVLLASVAFLAAPLCAALAQPRASQTELGFIERLYREGDGLRAETEALRWLHANPAHPMQPEVELLRAKLYYREGRLAEAELMVHSLRDRFPQSGAAREGARLLAYASVREGRPRDAGPWLAAARTEPPPLAPLLEIPPAEADEARAVAWSTGLPGAGFFVLNQPAKAAAALTLNLAFTAGAVIAYQQQNTPAALLFALIEVALYRGGRQAVREEAQRLAGRWRRERADDWLRRAGEPEWLGVAFTANF
jgi:hypothetical protein